MIKQNFESWYREIVEEVSTGRIIKEIYTTAYRYFTLSKKGY